MKLESRRDKGNKKNPTKIIHLTFCHRNENFEITTSVRGGISRLDSYMMKYFQIDTILGENTIEASYTSCPMGEEGLECRRAEARRSVDCPRGKNPRRWDGCNILSALTIMKNVALIRSLTIEILTLTIAAPRWLYVDATGGVNASHP